MKNSVTLLLVCLVASSFAAAAPEGADHEKIRPVLTVMSEIRQSQGVAADDRIDPAKVNDEQLEELGESVMEERLGNHQLHEWMDNMMGGEGSASLAAMHRQMGYNYLRGGRGGMMPGLGGGMMGARGPIGGRGRDSNWYGGNMMNRGWNHMWGFGSVWGWILMAAFWIAVIAGVVALIVWLVRQSRPRASGTSAVEILKARYARGEISKEEFEAKKKDLA